MGRTRCTPARSLEGRVRGRSSEPKGAGKSTLLASLNEIGVPIVTDDVLVFAGTAVMAGPRCIDLRPDAQRFGLGVAVRPSDPRNRIVLPPIAAEHHLAGVIHLEWSSAETTIEPLDHREAIRRLLILRSDKGYPRSPQVLLDFALLPTVLLKRPRLIAGWMRPSLRWSVCCPSRRGPKARPRWGLSRVADRQEQLGSQSR